MSKVNIGQWDTVLSDDVIDIADELAYRANYERNHGKAIFPPQDQIFRALQLTTPEKVKVVLVGQDPYHGAGQANGLAFSVSPGVPIPPSLRNIFKELREDLGYSTPTSGDLTSWAKQGVLLLNTVLTVEEGKANSNKDWGWQDFVLEVFKVCASFPQPIVFLLWGGQARAFCAGLLLQVEKNKRCLWSSHPSPLGASSGNEAVPAFLGSRPFSKTNALLQQMGAEPIDWKLG